MIFRRMAPFAEVLTLTPVIEEYKRRYPNTNIFIETRHPEIFENNNFVDGVDVFFNTEEKEGFIDFDELDVFAGIHLLDLFAFQGLGDMRLKCRQLKIYPSEDDKKFVNEWVENNTDGPFIVYCFDGEFITTSKEVKDRVREYLERDYRIIEPIEKWSVQKIKHLISLAQACIGSDSRDSYIGMTTETPMVMSFAHNNPKFRFPFRKGIPFEALFTRPEICEHAEVCLSRFGLGENGIIHGIDCQKEESFKCRKGPTADEFIHAIERLCLQKTTR